MMVGKTAVKKVDCSVEMKVVQTAISTAVQMETGRLEEDTEVGLVPPLHKKTRLED